MDLSTTHTQESGRRLRSRGVTVAIMMAITLAFSVISVPKATAFDDANPVSGVDVADWQHPDGSDIDWKSVEADGQKFAFIKATEGQGYTNPYFEDDVKQAKEAGLRVGSYHFARPGESAALQAANYANTIRTMPQPSLPPVLDIESDDGVGPEEVQRWVKEFVTEVEALTGRTPMIYTYRYFWSEQMGDTTDFKDYPLWLAAYQDEVPTELPGGWEYMTFWQRSDSGNVNGITGNTDMNLFNGSEAELDSLGTGNQVKLGKVLTPNFKASDALGSSNLGALSRNNGEIVGIILALALGAVSIGSLNDAASSAGFDAGGTKTLAGEVQKQIDNKTLPVDDLKRMADKNEYSIGDLIILLSNASK